MKKIYLLFILFTAFSCIAAGQAGILDNSFGTGGVVTTSVNGTGSSEVWGMAIQSDWSIVVGGFAFNGTDSDFALIRYTPNGSIDPDFGNNGIVTTDINGGNDVVYSVALQPDGKIVAAGVAFNGINNDFALARYNTNGSLDTTFGNGGKVMTAMGPGNDKGTSLQINSDWSIVVGGMASNGSNQDFALAKYNTNGTLDTNFGVNGKVTTPIGAANDMAFSLAIQTDWSIVLGGVAFNGTDYDFAIARYDSSGALDHTFGNNGIVTTDVSNKKDFIWSLIVQPDGKILAGGYITNLLNNTDFAIVRYNTDGTIDNTFGAAGKAITPIGTGDEDIYSMVLQPDGKIVAGGASDDNNAIENYALVRYNFDGTPDLGFGVNGLVTTPLSTGDNEIYAVALQPDGKIVAAGYAGDTLRQDCSVARYLPDLTTGVIDFAAMDNSVFIYPNPVAKDAVLKYTLSKDETISIRLFDMQGRTVKTFTQNQPQAKGEHQQLITLPASLASGSYLLTISSPAGKMSIKIVK